MLYIKALHIIFVITWFSGLFYVVRLFIYNREAQDRPENEKVILTAQYRIMIRRLWWGITWPSAVLTLIWGTVLLSLFDTFPNWLCLKLFFLAGLFSYHASLQLIYKQQMQNNFRLSSRQLRVWNEVATIFLVAIVMLVIVRDSMSLLWGILGITLLTIALLTAIKIYQKFRK